MDILSIDELKKSKKLSNVSSRRPRLSLYDSKLSYPKRSWQPSFQKIDEEGVPDCINWNRYEVAEWIEELGFPHYKQCFAKNFINGKRLILINASNLPKLGIHDFEDIKLIAEEIRNLLFIPFISDDHSIADPYTNELGVYLEDFAVTKVFPSTLTYKEVIEKFECLKLKPPLHNIISY